MKKFFIKVTLVAVSLAMALPCAAQEWPKQLVYGAYSKLSDSYPPTIGLAQLITKYTPTKCIIRSYAGGTPGLAALVKGDIDLWGMNQYGEYQAYYGLGAFKDKPQNIRLVSSVFTGGLAFGVRPNSGINKIEDLAGKRVMCLWVSEFTNDTDKTILEYYGLWDKITRVRYVRFSEIVDAMTDKTVEAFGQAVGAGYTLQIKEAAGLKWLPVSDGAINHVTKKIRTAVKYVFPPSLLKMYDMPPNTVFNSWAYQFSQVCKAELPDYVVYEIVKAIYEKGHVDEVKMLSYHLEEVNLKAAAGGGDGGFEVPYHKGAIKYFKEKGVWTAADAAKQKELLASRGFTE
ncbi:TAXI family TRAP transporter solute-binding subunit [Thermodesulfobacteriota bacterium]